MPLQTRWCKRAADLKRPVRATIACIAALSSLGGCSHKHSAIAVVNVTAIEQSWPKFMNYSNQLQANFIAIRDSKEGSNVKRKAFAQLQQQSQRWQDEVSSDVRSAVRNIASQRHYDMVVTRQGVAFGGEDITDDVKTALKIPLSTPSPSPSK